ncbi:MAG: hypothetical protein US76_01030 [Parcubacteria group bacterium GW2011_GWA2_38_13b]|nr:MAG: hypothetical protein US76_01030 [Parcubacteria group bacterium GW2011_GWA2_38_13b]
MDKIYAKKISEDTRRNYNLIADDFSRTRRNLWPELSFLKEYVENGDKILDLGCGNGRLIELFKDMDVEYVGVDSSEKLIEEAKNKFSIFNFQFLLNDQISKFSIKPKFIVADGINLPFPDNYFDKIFSIAVLHHIPSRELRLKFLSEARRVLKKDGIAVFTVWNLWQKKGIKFQIKYFFLKILGLSRLDFKDILMPYAAKNAKVLRYYHAFTKKELNNLFLKAKFTANKAGLLSRGDEKGNYYNYYIIAKKLN